LSTFSPSTYLQVGSLNTKKEIGYTTFLFKLGFIYLVHVDPASNGDKDSCGLHSPTGYEKMLADLISQNIHTHASAIIVGDEVHIKINKSFESMARQHLVMHRRYFQRLSRIPALHLKHLRLRFVIPQVTKYCICKETIRTKKRVVLTAHGVEHFFVIK
jgi:hypothetical protein